MAGVTPTAYLKLLKDGKYTDFTIVCKNVEYKVHKVIVCGASTMLDAACGGSFQEATTGKIEFPEEHPAILARAILFMYTSDYDVVKPPDVLLPGNIQRQYLPAASQGGEEEAPSPEFSEDESRKVEKMRKKAYVFGKTAYQRIFENLQTNVSVYKCADMLGIENPKVLAADRFLADASTVYTEAAFAEPLRTMYESTRSDDDHLRIPVTTLCVRNHYLLKDVPEVVSVIEQHEYKTWTVHVALLNDTVQNKAKERGTAQKIVDVINLYNRDHCCDTRPRAWGVAEDGSIMAYCGEYYCAPKKI